MPGIINSPKKLETYIRVLYPIPWHSIGLWGSRGRAIGVILSLLGRNFYPISSLCLTTEKNNSSPSVTVPTTASSTTTRYIPPLLS